MSMSTLIQNIPHDGRSFESGRAEKLIQATW
jgi:hypothetical protein